MAFFHKFIVLILLLTHTSISSGITNILNTTLQINGDADLGAIPGSPTNDIFLDNGILQISTMAATISEPINYLIVAGGGGSGNNGGGGGGAGGFLTSSTTLTVMSNSIVVGAGGAGNFSGGNSSAFGITAFGGGYGAGRDGGGVGSGGSGGGGAITTIPAQAIAGTGTPGQGNNGMAGAGNNGAGGGGGGAGAAATNSNGGVGLSSSITGSLVFYAGGGAASGGVGGNGGGGNPNVVGTPNTGGGGGAGGVGYSAVAGGSGIVIVSYSGIQKATGGTITSSGGNTIHSFTSSGTLAVYKSINANRTMVLNAGGGTLAPLGPLTYNGIISGSGNLTLNLGTSLNLGGNSTYTGTTSITSGTLFTGIPNAISGTTGLIMSTTTTSAFNLSNFNQTVGSLSGGASSTVGNIVLGSATLSISQTSPGTYGGVISGTGGLTLLSTSNSTLTLTNINTYTGVTNFNGGVTQINAANRLGSSSALTFNGGALEIIGVGSSVSLGQGITLNIGGATLTPNSGNTLTLSGVINNTGNGPLTMSGDGTLVLSGANTYTGITNFNGGVTQINAANRLGSSSALTFNGGTLEITGVGSSVSLGQGITLNTSGATLKPNSGNTLTLSGIINNTGNGPLKMNDAGTLVLSGVNTYTGATTIAAGTLQAGAANIISTSSSVTMSGTAAFNFITFSQTINTLVGAAGNTINMGTGNFTINQNTSGTFAGVLSGGGNLTVQGTAGNPLTFSGVNTYTGSTTIKGNTLIISAANNLGSTSSIILNHTADNNGILQAITNDVVLSQTITLNGNGTVMMDPSKILTLNRLISGIGGFTMNGAGTLLLNATNTYTGATSIASGTVQAGITDVMSSSSSVTMSGTAAFNFITFGQTINTLVGASGNTINMGTGDFTINQNASGTFAGVLSGSGNLLVQGTAGNPLTLSGVNTYTGSTTIKGNTLIISAANNLGSTSGIIFNNTGGNDGILQTITNDVTLTQGITLTGNGTVMPSASTTLTLSGKITSSGQLTMNGAGNLVLSSITSDYTGVTNFNAGITKISDSRNLGVTSALTFNGGALEITGVGSSVTLTQGGTLTGNATLIPDNGNTLTLSGNITGAGQLTINGAGTVVLSGTASNYTGATNFNAGTTKISASNKLGSSSALTFNGGTLQATATLTLTQDITLNASGGTLSTNTFGVILISSGQISGAGPLNITTAPLPFPSFVSLTGTNTYTGNTTVAGLLLISAANNLGSSASLIFKSGSLTTSGTLGLTQNISLTGNGVFSPNSGTTLTLSGVISGAGQLSMNGAGTLLLSGANTYTGITNFNAGVTQISAANNLGSSSALVLNGGTLELIGVGTSANVSQGITLSTGGGTLITDSGDTLTLSGVVAQGAGAGQLTKSGAGTLVLSGTNTYTGVTNFNAGITQISAANNLGASSALTFNGGTLEITGVGTNVTLTQDITLTGNATLMPDSGNTLTLSGKITSSGQLTKTDAGTLVLSSITSDYTGVTNFNAGITQISDSRNLGASSALTFNGGTLQNTATLTLTQDVTLNASGATFSPNGGTVLTLNGAIGGTGALTQSAAGTLVLGGVNNYSGGTNVTAGTLQVVGTSIPSSGNITVTGGTFYLSSGSSPSVVLDNQASGTVRVAGTFTAANTSSNAGVINVYSGGNFVAPAVFTNTGTTNINGTGTVSGSFSGTGGAVLNIGGVAVATSSISSNISIPTININTIGGVGSTLTVNNNLTYVGGTLNVQALSSLIFATGMSNSMNLNNSGTVSMLGTVTNAGAITNDNILNITATILGGGSITNNSPGVLTLTNSTINNALTNDNVLNVVGANIANASFTNNLTTNIATNSSLTLNASSSMIALGSILGAGTGSSSLILNQNFSSSGMINNVDNISIAAGKTLTLGAASTLANYTNLTVDGNITLGGGQTLTLGGNTSVSSSTFTGDFVFAGVNFTVSNLLTCTQALTINNGNSQINNITAPALTINGGTHTLSGFNLTNDLNIGSSSKVNLNGNGTATNIINAGVLSTTSPQTLTADYLLSGTHIATFTNASNIGALSVNGNADFSAGTVVVDFANGAQTTSTGQYDIVIVSGIFNPPSDGSLQIRNLPDGCLASVHSTNNKIYLDFENILADIARTDLSVPSINGNNILSTLKNILDDNNANHAIRNLAQNIILDINRKMDDNNAIAATDSLLQIAPNPTLPVMHDNAFGSVLHTVAVQVADHRQSYQAGIDANDYAVWFKPVIVFTNQGASNESLGYHSATGGFVFGSQVRFNEIFTLGLAGGYAATKSKQNTSFGSIDNIDSWNFIPYFYIANEKHAFDCLYSYSRASVATSREAYNMSTNARYNSHESSFKVSYGYKFKLNPEFVFMPKLAFKYSKLSTVSYQENGDNLALKVTMTPPRNNYEVEMGLSIVQTPLPLAEYNFKTEFNLTALWYPGARQIVTNSQFVLGGEAFKYNILMPKKALRAGVSISYSLLQDVDLKFQYAYKFAHKYTEHFGSIALKYLF